jgi:hypothetical protein
MDAQMKREAAEMTASLFFHKYIDIMFMLFYKEQTERNGAFF